jgi:hypothetical protein
LGPQEGYKVILKSSDGTTIEIIGVGSQSNNFKIKEFYILPDDYPKPSFAQKIIERNYTIISSDDKLIKKGSWGETILLQKPLQINKPRWTIPVRVGKLDSETGNSSQVPPKVKCSIFAKEFLQIVNERRLTVTSECKIVTKDTLIERFKYAEGLGLIENVSLFQDPDGTIHEISKLSLIEVQKVDN